MSKSESEKWFDECEGTGESQPIVIPTVGIRIEVRMLVKSADDWQYVRETLDDARRYGAAEVVEYKTFQDKR